MEGIIIRSRARNLVRKHIRKRRLSGVISTDPFEILEAERVLYENLYKSRRDGSEENKPNFHFHDLPIPTLSNNSSYLGVGLISIEECKTVLNSFPLNKVPGNDGLSIEFYKTFWDLIGDLLVASFNEYFANGTMSPSQRQAVITLIEKKDQDRCDLKNWRPISLLNVDAKE